MKGFFLPLDFESTKAGRPAPAAHRMPIAEAQTAAGVKLLAADHRADERKTDAPADAGRRRPDEETEEGDQLSHSSISNNYITLQYNAFII